jgi:hypothetical protein
MKNDLREIKDSSDLKKDNAVDNHICLKQLKHCGVSILKVMMWFLGIAFTSYIIWFLMLTSIKEESIIMTNMQTIITSASGWLLLHI